MHFVISGDWYLKRAVCISTHQSIAQQGIGVFDGCAVFQSVDIGPDPRLPHTTRSTNLEPPMEKPQEGKIASRKEAEEITEKGVRFEEEEEERSLCENDGSEKINARR